ncbi:MAG: hypothetical protein QNK22_01020 [Xanthomonadales bacterium]|nr:hypothetical protein [Xanthomonadales bacterium]
MSGIKPSSFRPRMSPQPVPKIGNSERMRAAFLDAALEFIWSHPFRDMTVNSLMASAGPEPPSVLPVFQRSARDDKASN